MLKLSEENKEAVLAIVFSVGGLIIGYFWNLELLFWLSSVVLLIWILVMIIKYLQRFTPEKKSKIEEFIDEIESKIYNSEDYTFEKSSFESLSRIQKEVFTFYLFEGVFFQGGLFEVFTHLDTNLIQYMPELFQKSLPDLSKAIKLAYSHHESLLKELNISTDEVDSNEMYANSMMEYTSRLKIESNEKIEKAIANVMSKFESQK